ncbi:MAG: AAA family ATPase [Planctomycetes bacterium]|nr:AAA family ATPase [Planctomycetota bacterium]
MDNPDALALARLLESVARVYRGPALAVELVAVAFLARGHALVEDIPGVGKTTLARAFAAAAGLRFKRVQCTPDLMPADITGVSIWDERDHAFRFHPGPVFGEVLLADELNRTPPRTQSALLEALAEGQVTVDGEARALPPLFFCIATQNPADHAGTYPLPDSQRDRFLVSFRLGYPAQDQELAILAHDGADDAMGALHATLDAAAAGRLRALARRVRVDPEVQRYLLAVVRATRGAKGVVQGASPRAALGLQRACQARAVLNGRDFAIPDDVQALAAPCLAHRVAVRAGSHAEAAIQAVVEATPVPR